MKVHSYVSTNGYLHWVDGQAQAALKDLYALAEESDGSYEAALEAAKINRKKLDDEAATAASHSSSTSSTNGTPPVPDGVTATYIDPVAAVAFRQRLNLPTPTSPMKNSATSSSPRAPPPPPLKILETATSESPVSTPSDSQLTDKKLETTGTNVLDPSTVRKPSEPHPLCDHPDEKIAALAREYSDMDSELVSTGPEYIRWPENITWKNFAVYQLIPTLVYELEYPRTDRCVSFSVFVGISLLIFTI